MHKQLVISYPSNMPLGHTNIILILHKTEGEGLVYFTFLVYLPG